MRLERVVERRVTFNNSPQIYDKLACGHHVMNWGTDYFARYCETCEEINNFMQLRLF